MGWGIAWYINGLLIPEINVVRGKTYTFVVEGGDDKQFAAGYHPFYITDDPEGGYEHKSEAERRRLQVFAGVKQTRFGGTVPSATGRLCEWKEDVKKPANQFSSFGAYQRSLSLYCQEGNDVSRKHIHTWNTMQYHILLIFRSAWNLAMDTRRQDS